MTHWFGNQIMLATVVLAKNDVSCRLGIEWESVPPFENGGKGEARRPELCLNTDMCIVPGLESRSPETPKAPEPLINPKDL